MLDKLLRLFCIHKYGKEEFIEEYYDSLGFKTLVYKCKCRKCGKTKNVKYVALEKMKL